MVSTETAQPTPAPKDSPNLDHLHLSLRGLTADLVLSRVPAAPPEVSTVGPRDRQFDRTLDVAGENLKVAAIDPTLEAVHDIAGAVFQRWLDGLAGKACPLRADNERLVQLVTDRANSFGFGLYLQYHEEMVRVRIDVGVNRSKRDANPDAPSVLAGAFDIHVVREPTEKSCGRAGKLTSWSTFPQLVVARSREHARRLISGDTVVGHNTSVSDRDNLAPRPDVSSWELTA